MLILSKRGGSEINKELILNELKRTREALNNAIAYIEAEELPVRSPAGVRMIRTGEGRAVAILASLRDTKDGLSQYEFEKLCARNCRTLVGAGGFIARGSIARSASGTGDVVYEITDKGLETVSRWEARYGADWMINLEKPGILGDAAYNDHQKIKLLI